MSSSVVSMLVPLGAVESDKDTVITKTAAFIAEESNDSSISTQLKPCTGNNILEGNWVNVEGDEASAIIYSPSCRSKPGRLS